MDLGVTKRGRGAATRSGRGEKGGAPRKRVRRTGSTEEMNWRIEIGRVKSDERERQRKTMRVVHLESDGNQEGWHFHC